MSIKAKHLATFILGAAAGVAMNKYMNTEDGEKMMESLKEKGKQLKSEAEGAMDKGYDYFEDLKSGANDKLSDVIGSLKEKYPEAEKMINDLFASISKGGDAGTSATVIDDEPTEA